MRRTAPRSSGRNPPLPLIAGAVLVAVAVASFFLGAPLVAYLSVGLLLLCPLLLLRNGSARRDASKNRAAEGQR